MGQRQRWQSFPFVSKSRLSAVLGAILLVGASLLVGRVAARAGSDEIAWEVAALTLRNARTERHHRSAGSYLGQL